MYSYTPGFIDKIVVHNGITADATSDAEPCFGAKSISLVFTEAGTVLNRSGVLTISISNDGVTYVDYSMLIDNVANANSEQLTRVASKTRAAAGSDILFFAPETVGAFAFFKVKIDITDTTTPTGNFSVVANVQY